MKPQPSLDDGTCTHHGDPCRPSPFRGGENEEARPSLSPLLAHKCIHRAPHTKTRVPRGGGRPCADSFPPIVPPPCPRGFHGLLQQQAWEEAAHNPYPTPTLVVSETHAASPRRPYLSHRHAPRRRATPHTHPWPRAGHAAHPAWMACKMRLLPLPGAHHGHTPIVLVPNHRGGGTKGAPRDAVGRMPPSHPIPGHPPTTHPCSPPAFPPPPKHPTATNSPPPFFPSKQHGGPNQAAAFQAPHLAGQVPCPQAGGGQDPRAQGVRRGGRRCPRLPLPPL